MEAGTKVIVTGLVGRKDLNNKHATALRLNAKSGSYIVKIEGVEELVKIKVSNLVVKDHKEEVSGDMLICNGLFYCAAHRLEVCGSCGYRFCMQNRAKSLGLGSSPEESKRIFAQAEALEALEAKQNLPPLRAPRAGFPSEDQKQLLESTKFSKKELVARGLNPAELGTWDDAADGSIARPFEQAFSMQEAMMSRSPGGCPVNLQRPLFRLRQALLCVGRECAKKCANPAVLLPRFAVEDEAESEVLLWDVLRMDKMPKKDTKKGGAEDEYEDGDDADGKFTPMLTVRWAYVTAAGMPQFVGSLNASFKLNPPGTPSMKMGASVAEVRGLKALLETNAKRLDPGFVAAQEVGLPSGWAVSTLHPISTEAKKEAAADPAGDNGGGGSVCCASCGKKRALKVCSRCKETKYCSAECQVAHWKAGHKAACKAPGGGGGGGGAHHGEGLVPVDLAAPRNPHFRNNPDHVSVTFAFSSSMKRSGSLGAKGGGVADRPFKDDVMFVVKVQIFTSTGFNPNCPMGMLVYDKSRRFDWNISCTNCPEAAYRRLDTTIRSGKIFGKGYFKAYFSKEKLLILVNSPLPLQPW